MEKVSLIGLVSGKLGDIVMYAYLPRLYQAPRTDAQVRQRAKFNIIVRLIKLVSPVMFTSHQQGSNQDNRFGDWGMDFIVGKDGKGAIVTLLEHTFKNLFMAKSPRGKNAKAVAKFVVQLPKSFEQHVRTITTVNGTESAGMKKGVNAIRWTLVRY